MPVQHTAVSDCITLSRCIEVRRYLLSTYLMLLAALPRLQLRRKEAPSCAAVAVCLSAKATHCTKTNTDMFLVCSVDIAD